MCHPEERSDVRVYVARKEKNMKFRVKGTGILHNGKLYAEGKTINLEDEEAKQLADYLEPIPEKTSGKQAKPAKEPENQDEASPENKEGNE